jgi:small GTP-binding protein
MSESESGPWGEEEESVHSSTDSGEKQAAETDESAGVMGADGFVYKFVPCSKPRNYDPDGALDEDDAKTASVELAIVGDAAVGKTSIVQTFVRRKFPGRTRTTIGVDFQNVWLKSRAPHWDRKTNVSLVDCAGQDRFSAILPQKLRSPYGILMVFDTTRESTFHSMFNWAKKISQHNEHCCRMLVGNKMDLYRQLPPEKQWMSSLNWDHVQDQLECDEGRFMVSAKMMEGIDSMIVEMVDCALDRQDEIEREQEAIDADEQQRAQRYAASNHTVTLNISQTHTKNNNCKC